MVMALILRNSSRPLRPNSRPQPDCLLPSERRLRAHGGVDVDPDLTRVDPAGDPQAAGDVVGPDRAGKSVRRVVDHPHQLILVVEAEDAEHRAEDLLPRDAHVRRHAGEHYRAQEVAGALQRFVTTDHGGALVQTSLDILAHPRLLPGGDQRGRGWSLRPWRFRRAWPR